MQASAQTGWRDSLSAEYQILLACARSRMDDVHARVIRENTRLPIDWAVLAAVARRHSLLPLLYRQIAPLAPPDIPAAWLVDLKNLYQANAARNVLLLGELDSLLRAMREDGVTAIAYKGPVLAAAGYGDLALRRFVDLDVIVRPQDVPRSIATLLRLGYASDPAVSPAQQGFLMKTQHEFAFRRDSGRLIVELHTAAAADRFAAGMQAEDFWNRVVPVPVGRAELLTLSAEDTLLALCVHGSKHLWERLAWVCDIAEWIAAHPRLEWADILARAERNGQLRMLLTGLQLAADLLDAPLPDRVAAAATSDLAVVEMVAQAKAVIFRDPPRPPGMISGLRFNFLARTSWSSRIDYLRHIMTPTVADVCALDLPRALQFVYYLSRPFRLFGKTEHLH